MNKIVMTGLLKPSELRHWREYMSNERLMAWSVGFLDRGP